MAFENFNNSRENKFEEGGSIPVDSARRVTERQETIPQENKDNSEFITNLNKLSDDINKDLGDITENNYLERIIALKDIHGRYKQNLEKFADVVGDDRDDMEFYRAVLREQMIKINKKVVEYKAFKENYNKNKETLVLKDDNNYANSYIKKTEDSEKEDNFVMKSKQIQIKNSGELSEADRVAHNNEEKEEIIVNVADGENINKGERSDDSIEKLTYLEREALRNRRKVLKEQIDAHTVLFDQIWQIGTEDDKKLYYEKREEFRKELEQINEKLGITEAEEKLEESKYQLDKSRTKFIQKKVLTDKMKGFFNLGSDGQIVEEMEKANSEYLKSQKKYVDEFISMKEIDGKVSLEDASNLLRIIKVQEFIKLDFEEKKIKFHDRKESFGKFMSGKMVVALSLGMEKIDDFFHSKKMDNDKLEQNSDVIDRAQHIKEEVRVNKDGSEKGGINSVKLKSILFDEDGDSIQENRYKKNGQDGKKSKSNSESEGESEGEGEGEGEGENKEFKMESKNIAEVGEILKEEALREKREKIEKELKSRTELSWKSIKNEYDIDQKIHDAGMKFRVVVRNLFNAGESRRDIVSQKLEFRALDSKKYIEMFRTILDTEIGIGTRIVLDGELVSDIENSRVINLSSKKVQKFQKIKLLIGGVLHESSNSNNETLKDYRERVVIEMYNKCVVNENCNDVELENFNMIFNSYKHIEIQKNL